MHLYSVAAPPSEKFALLASISASSMDLIQAVRGLGAVLQHILGWSHGKHKYRAFPSRRQSLRAATSSLEKKVLLLL